MRQPLLKLWTFRPLISSTRALYSARRSPKVTPQRLADTIVHALQQGIENVTLGPVAEDIVHRFKDDPFVLERELMHASEGQAV